MCELCSQGEGQVSAGLQGREERVMLLEPCPCTATQEKHELQCKNIVLGGACFQEQTLGWRQKVCIFGLYFSCRLLTRLF